MLDTGIDVPSVRNLVFAKPVFSKVKFWQMLGRGTRTWTDPISGEKKADFLVIDHWDNFDYFQVNKDGCAGAVSEPLPTRLFRSISRPLLVQLASFATWSVPYLWRTLTSPHTQKTYVRSPAATRLGVT
jgi:hypothetical protein